MKILVTGANGYLGQGIVKAILDNGHDVVAADFAVDLVDDRAEKVAGNMFEVEKPYEYFGKPDVLLHLAWRDGFVHYSNAHIDDLPKHFAFIRQMAEEGVKQIAVMGSMHEIGFFEGSINENTPCHPTTPYGIGKNALRDLTQMVCKQKNIVFQWMRGYYIVGNSKYGSSIFSKSQLRLKKEKQNFHLLLARTSMILLTIRISVIRLQQLLASRRSRVLSIFVLEDLRS